MQDILNESRIHAIVIILKNQKVGTTITLWWFLLLFADLLNIYLQVLKFFQVTFIFKIIDRSLLNFEHGRNWASFDIKMLVNRRNFGHVDRSWFKIEGLI